MKKVILILSTYNGEKYLPALLDSVYGQTYPHIDLYIRDDGSTDSTVSILKSYQAKNITGRQLILVNEKTGDWTNKGAHQSYRLLIGSLSDADYYVFCDQDDVWEKQKVERAVSHMEKYPSDIPVLYAHNCYVCDGNLQIEHTFDPLVSVSHREMTKISLAKVIMTGTWAGVGMAQAFNHTLKRLTFDTGETDPSIAVDCWISWVAAGMNGAFEYDAVPLAYYRRHTGTYSSGNAGGLARYKDWKKHMDRHCRNIVNGIHYYKNLYYEMVSPERQKFLALFDSPKRFRKFMYPHRLRSQIFDEIAFRILILAGKI